jgi:hypothetical protein
MEHDVKNQPEQRTNDDANADAPSNQSIRIMGFVDGDVIPPACYDKPYCLEPGKNDSKAYEVLREVMQRTRKVGLAAVMIEKRETLAAVIPIGRTLVLNVLRFATSLVPRVRSAASHATSATVATLPPAKPRTAPSAAVPASTRRARAPLALAAEAPKTVAPAARMTPARKQGEVIDLAVRRSSKRATGRNDRAAKSRTRSTGVATLHPLRRKNSGGRGTPEIQLA